MNDIVRAFFSLVKAGQRLIQRLHAISSSENPLNIECEVGCGLPKRIATPVPIDPDLLADDEYEAVCEEHYLRSAIRPSFAGECHIRLRVENVSEQRVSIRSISFGKSAILDKTAKGSMLFIPQGGTFGAPLRLACELDRNCPHMQEYLQEERPKLVGDDNYFVYGSVELDPGEIQNFKISAYTHQKAYHCTLQMRYEIGGKTRVEDILDEAYSFDIYPLESIPTDQRFWRTYSLVPPWIQNENEWCEHFTYW